VSPGDGEFLLKRIQRGGAGASTAAFWWFGRNILGSWVKFD
jgi:hypothetical protein